MLPPARNGFAGDLGGPSRSTLGEGLCRRRCLELIDGELPGVGEDGMSGRNGQRKLGTTRGSPRRSRTAKASRISRFAAKSRCACEWGGWGRLSFHSRCAPGFMKRMYPMGAVGSEVGFDLVLSSP